MSDILDKANSVEDYMKYGTALHVQFTLDFLNSHL